MMLWLRLTVIAVISVCIAKFGFGLGAEDTFESGAYMVGACVALSAVITGLSEIALELLKWKGRRK